MFRRTTISLILLAGILFAAGPALADNHVDGAADGTTMPPTTDEAMEGASGGMDTTPGTDMYDGGTDAGTAMEQVPTWEELTPEEAGKEPPYESFLRLAEDYIYRSEIGTRSVGRIPVWPRGAFKVGPVNLFPYLEGRAGWTDNVYQDATEESSWYFSGGGGLTAELPFAGGQGNLTGAGDYRALTYTDEDVEYAEWTIGLAVGYRFQRGYWIKAGAKWQRLVDPVQLQDSGLQRRDNLYPYVDLGWDNVGNSKINVQAGADLRSYEYQDDDFDTGNRDEYRGYVRVSYPVFRDVTRVYVKYTHYYTDADSERINNLKNGGEISFGMDGVIPLTKSEKLTGTLQIGYRSNKYETGSYRQGDDNEKILTDPDDNIGIVTVRAALRYLASARTSVEVMYLRDTDFSTFSNWQVVDRFDVIVMHTLMRDLVLRAGAYVRFSDPDGGGDRGNITQFGAGVGARYLLMDNFDVDASIDWFDRQADEVLYEYSRFIGSVGVTIYWR